MRYISPALWATIRRHWCLGTLTLTDIARRYSISDSTIRKRASLENWPDRGSSHADAEMMLHVHTEDAVRALETIISEMAAQPAPPDKADARELRAIIRALGQSIRALREMQRRDPKAASTAAPDYTEDDKAFVLAKLHRMRRPRPESPPCDPTASSTASPTEPNAAPTPSSTA